MAGETFVPTLVTFPVEMTILMAASVDALSYCSPCTRTIDDDEVCVVCLDNLNSSNWREVSGSKDIDDNKLKLASSEDSMRRRAGEEDQKKEVRELIYSCRHVFHRGCLHAWVAGGHATCPVCRAKFLPERDGDHRKGIGAGEIDRPAAANRDPWRLERMIYLFGEDIMF